MPWLVLGASVIGNSHLKIDTPCQDAWSTQTTSDGRHVVVAVADGAGSRTQSHLGSRFIADNAVSIAINLLEEKGEEILSNSLRWKELGQHLLATLIADLQCFAEENQYQIDDLASTLILCIISESSIACLHVGDGRAAVKTVSETGELWKPIMVPFKGTYANETVFVTSLSNHKDLSSSTFWTCQLIQEKVEAVAIMSDGCEGFSYLLRTEPVSTDSEESKQFNGDLNQPYAPFLNGLFGMIQQALLSDISEENLSVHWEEFLQKGNSKIALEPDDKTFVFIVPKIQGAEPQEPLELTTDSLRE